MPDINAVVEAADPMPRSLTPNSSSEIAARVLRLVESRYELASGDVAVSAGHPKRDAHRLALIGVLTIVTCAVLIGPALLFNSPGGGYVHSIPLTFVPGTGTPPVSHMPWPETVLSRGDNIAANTLTDLPGSAFAFAFEVDKCHEPCSEPFERIDSTTGAVTAGPTVTAGSFLVTARQLLFLLSPGGVSAMGNVSGGWWIRSVNTTSLHLGPAYRLGFLGNSGGVAAVGIASPLGPRLWIAGHGRLSFVDAEDGRVLRSTSLAVSGLTVSPDDEILYALGSSKYSAARILEIDALTGQLVAESRDSYYSGVSFTAVTGGVWVTGYKGSPVLLSAKSLRPVVLASGVLPPNPAERGVVTSVSVYRLGPDVWIRGYKGITCVAEANTKLRGTALVAEAEDSWVPFKIVGYTVFAVDSGKVVAISPPVACFG
jgi:hypothetical protein